MLRSVLFAFFVGRTSAKALRSSDATRGFDYDYSQNGKDWTEGFCADPERQSPVNFDVLDSAPTGKLMFTYQVLQSSFEFVNNAHTLSADFAGLGYGGLTYEESWYNLLNVNFHALSEHTFQGKHYPLEMHLLHKKFDSDDFVVLAVPISHTNKTMPASLIAERRALRSKRKSLPMAPLPKYLVPNKADVHFNKQLQHFLKIAPPLMNQKNIAICDKLDPFDISSFVEGGTYLEYAGSMTAPPCATNTIWFVRRDPVMASEAQIQTMVDAIYETNGDVGNFRQTFPINGRHISTSVAVKEAAPPVPEEEGIRVAPVQGREAQAMRWAKDALKLSKKTSDYIYNLDTRLKHAARAHVDALAPDIGVAAITPAPRPVVNEVMPVNMAKTAEVMAKAIAKAAREAIDSASTEITAAAEQAAKQAAKDAAIVAAKEVEIPTPRPLPGAPGAAPAAPAVKMGAHPGAAPAGAAPA